MQRGEGCYGKEVVVGCSMARRSGSPELEFRRHASRRWAEEVSKQARSRRIDLRPNEDGQ